MAWSVGRISSLQSTLSNSFGISRNAAKLQIASQEVGSGKYADIYATLGPKAASVMKLRAREDETQAYLSSNEVLSSKLQVMLDSVDFVRERVQGVLQNALSNSTSPINGAATLQMEAKAALESIVATLNTSFNGEFLFSGVNSDRATLNRWSQTNNTTGLSPEDVLNSIIGAGPTDAATAQATFDDISKVFDSTYSANPDSNFEATFYGGTPALAASGQPASRVTGRLSAGQELKYGVQANDPAIREVLKGLAMLASTDVSTISDGDAYASWMSNAVKSLSGGQEGLVTTSAGIGFNQQIVETAKTRLTDLSLLQRTQIGNYENVDTYEAVTRMTTLETQLQASYQVSVRLSSLSILKYI